MSKVKIYAGVMATACAVLAMNAGSALAEGKGTIRIAENDWTGQLVDINLAKIILSEHMGYDVELVFADYTGQWAGLASGDLDVGMELWPSLEVESVREWVHEKGKVEILGDLGVVATAGWFVPTYMIKGDSERGIEPMTPDLVSYEQLNKYASLFARTETGDKGFCLDSVPTWELHNEDRIKNLGLNFVNVFAGTEGSLVAEIQAAYEKGDPLLICNMWEPHWLMAALD
ncbi:hypothetical protein HA397_24275, partial [Escherichia coli]|nr:hypothetical protein [Escherichia coli]